MWASTPSPLRYFRQPIWIGVEVYVLSEVVTEMLPFEFVIPGIPVSQQTRNRKRLTQYKQEISALAAKRLPTGFIPIDGRVKITVVYYYESVPLDTDNFIKPVQDALIGVVYADDNQVFDIGLRKTDLTGSFRVKGMSAVLAEGFCSGKEFLYVRVERAPDHGDLL
jgi:Holliday junction resolvase RusA-like endonuclease